MECLSLTPGCTCWYQGQQVRINHLLNLQQVVIETAPGQLLTVAPEQLRAHAESEAPTPPHDVYQFQEEQTRQTALDRLAVIEPLLHQRVPNARLAEVAAQHGVGPTTLRRWLRAYAQAGLPGLIKQKHPGGKQRSRLPAPVERLLQQALQRQYLTLQQPTVAYVWEQLQATCRQQGLASPGLNTVRRRIAQLSAEERIRRRLGRQAAREQFAPVHPNTLPAEHPLDVVEMDHTLLNIMLLDERTHRPVGRPWLTLAMDVHSRLVVGFYLSFEVPGAGGTGLCLSHAILPKETWLAKHNIAGSWPSWGFMKVLHVDNAKEFCGTLVTRACAQYHIRLQHRPPGQPEFGGHIERLIKTIKVRVRHLPGAYLGSRRARRLYRPAERAVFTLPAFEKWLTTYIVSYYHVRVHSALGTGPLQHYEQALVAPQGPGVPARPTNEEQIRIDFMPFVERTIQRRGVVRGNYEYFDGVLTPYIGDIGSGPRRMGARKYIFRYDPRDESKLYFLDPVTKNYHTIPLRDTRQGPFSSLTKREAVRRFRAQHPEIKRLQEHNITAALREMDEQVLAAQQQDKARGGHSTKPLPPAQRRQRLEAAARNAPQLVPAAPTNPVDTAAALTDSDVAPDTMPLVLPFVPPFSDDDDDPSFFRYGRVADED